VSIALFLNRYGLVVLAILDDRSGIGGKIRNNEARSKEVKK